MDPAAPRSAMPAEVAWGLAESARRFGHYAWVEQRLFEILGGWVSAVPEPSAKVLLAEHSAHHAWHAQLWTERIPVLPEWTLERLVVPANATVAAFFDALAEPGEEPLTVERLAGVYRVLLPHTGAVYHDHLARTSRELDGPTVRVLRLVGRDEEDDRHEGDALLHALVRSPEHVARVAAHEARLHRMLVDAGGIAGPDSSRGPLHAAADSADVGTAAAGSATPTQAT